MVPTGYSSCDSAGFGCQSCNAAKNCAYCQTDLSCYVGNVSVVYNPACTYIAPANCSVPCEGNFDSYLCQDQQGCSWSYYPPLCYKPTPGSSVLPCGLYYDTTTTSSILLSQGDNIVVITWVARTWVRCLPCSWYVLH